jgi:PiT family inorganic phosphate transporter
MLVEFLIITSALYVGFNIGANDAANTMGACVGGGALGLRRAVLLAGVFVVLGGVLAGSGVAKTISEEIIPSGDLTPVAAAVCLFASGGVVALATIKGIPVSTSHAIILALVGAGLAMGTRLNADKLFWLAAAWVLLPIGMVVLSFALISTLQSFLSRVGSLVQLEIILKYMLIFSAVYASFALGANHAGLAGGMLEGVVFKGSGLSRFYATTIGSLTIAAGVILLSGRVIRTVGEGITALSPTSAFAMQFSTAVGLTVCSVFGLPVSSSQAVVAAAVGVGLAQGGSTINKRQVARIAGYWVLVPLGTMAICYFAMAWLA